MTINKLIFFAILIGFFIASLPVPKGLMYFKPDLVILTVLYWVIAIPGKKHFIVLFFIGFLLDVLSSYPLGINGFGIILLSYILAKIRNKFLTTSIWRQGLTIARLVVLQKIILLIYAIVYIDVVKRNEILIIIFCGFFINYISWIWLRLILDKYLLKITELQK